MQRISYKCQPNWRIIHERWDCKNGPISPKIWQFQVQIKSSAENIVIYWLNLMILLRKKKNKVKITLNGSVREKWKGILPYGWSLQILLLSVVSIRKNC